MQTLRFQDFVTGSLLFCNISDMNISWTGVFKLLTFMNVTHHLSELVSLYPQWKDRERMSVAEKMNSGLWNLDSIQTSLKIFFSEDGRQWEWCVILTSAAYSWKADSFFVKTGESPQTETPPEASITILFLDCLSLCLCFPLTHIFLLFIYFQLPPFSSPISSLFQSLLPHSFLSPSPITAKLQGGWLETFLTEKFGSDQNH